MDGFNRPTADIEAALVGVATLLPPPLTVPERSVLAFLSITAAFGALFVLGKLQRSTAVRQARLKATREMFGHAFQRAWSAEQKQDHPIQSVYLLRGGIVVTALLTLSLVTMRLGVA